MQGKMNVRVRIAPSPTGFPHIGTIYNALFNWAYAKGKNGVFFVRIEDTDRSRYVENAENVIYESLDWFGLAETESPRKGGPFIPYRQSERLPIYMEMAKKLIELGGAYYCFCTKERLETLRQKQQKEKKPTMYDRLCRNLSKDEVAQKLATDIPWVIRLLVPDKKDFVVKDGIRGEIDFDLSLIEDAILIKSDGFPTYHLAAMVDDHLMETSHIVRGEEWLPSLPKHVLIFSYFGWTTPEFFHTPTLRNADKTKLSKRQGHTSVKWYIEEGFLPEAILNYIALLGWSHPEGKEIFSLDEFVRLFDLKDMRPVAPIFDLQKLTWLNGEYIRMMKDKELMAKIKEFYKNDKDVLEVLESTTGEKLLQLAQTRIKTLKEFKELVVSVKVELSDDEKRVADIWKDKLQKVEEWNKDTLLEIIREVLKEEKIKGSVLYKIFTGREHGLPLPETLELLGKENSLKRLPNTL